MPTPVEQLKGLTKLYTQKFFKASVGPGREGAQEKRDQAPADVSTVGATDGEGVGAAPESQSSSQEDP